MPKRHPFRCMRSLTLAFRDPTDVGLAREKKTPSPEISHNNHLILPPAAHFEIQSLLKHVDKGCLSGIEPGRGTNRNERLHRELNVHVPCTYSPQTSSSQYGVELAYGLFTTTFYIHNDNILAKLEKRSPRPIMAYSNDITTCNEQFGLVNPRESTVVDNTLDETKHGVAKVKLDTLTFHEVREKANDQTYQVEYDVGDPLHYPSASSIKLPRE